MDNRRIFNLTSDFLVSACQLAYVEEAHGTLSILENLNDILRYITCPSETVTLYEELFALEKYIVLYRMRFGERISFLINNNSDNKAAYIVRLKVINAVDTFLVDLLENSEESVSVVLDLILNQNSKFVMRMVDGNGRQVIEKEL